MQVPSGSEWFLCVPELTRVQLADGALVDIFCSVYSVSCKVLNLHCFLLPKIQFQGSEKSVFGLFIFQTHIMLRVSERFSFTRLTESCWWKHWFSCRLFFFLLLFGFPSSWLPPVSRQDGESAHEFANKVQEVQSHQVSNTRANSKKEMWGQNECESDND